jgi:DNA polymerase-4
MGTEVMSTKTAKKIAFIEIHHMIAESEEARQDGEERFPLVVASGSQPKSVVLDYSRAIEDSPIKRGLYLKNIGFLHDRARVLPVDYEYVEALNERVIGYLRNYSPSVENPGIGEYLIDLTGTERLFGRTLDTCGTIVTQLGRVFRLTARCGIGSTILIARLAAEVAGDGGVYEILQNPEKLFFPPLSITLLPDLPLPLKNELLLDYSIRCMGDLLPFTKGDLTNLFGTEGELLYNYARGISRSTLLEKKTEEVLRRDCIINHERNDDDLIRRRFFNLVLELCEEMRREHVFPQAAKITVVYQDDFRYTTAGRLMHPSFYEEELYGELVFYLNRALKRRTCVKKIILSFSRFTAPSFQLSLFHDTFRTSELARAFDEIRRRFGAKSIGYGG